MKLPGPEWLVVHPAGVLAYLAVGSETKTPVSRVVNRISFAILRDDSSPLELPVPVPVADVSHPSWEHGHGIEVDRWEIRVHEGLSCGDRNRTSEGVGRQSDFVGRLFVGRLVLEELGHKSLGKHWTCDARLDPDEIRDL